MPEPVTEEMLSAYVDGELSSEDQLRVENAIARDRDLRLQVESFQELRSELQSSRQFIESCVLPRKGLADRVMAEILDPKNRSGREHASPLDPQVELGQSKLNEVRHSSRTKKYGSVRTLIEIVAGTAAIILIAISWQTPGATDGDGLALVNEGRQKVAFGQPRQKSQSGVAMMRVGDDDGSANSQTLNLVGPSKTLPSKASREFSVFVDNAARPQVDRFWTLHNYEIVAPESESPESGRSVSMFLVEAKKEHAVQFFNEVGRWDTGFRVFQDSRAGGETAAWLAPIDVDDAANMEGDVWKLRIVTLDR